MPFSDQYYLKRHNMKYHNGKVSTMEKPCTETYQHRDSGNAQAINEDYSEILSKLVINQQRNADFIQQNTLNILTILEITKELARNVEAGKEHQTEEIKTKTYSCQICDRKFKHSCSLSRHKSRFHPKDYGKAEDQKIMNSPYYLPSLQTLNNV